MGTLKHTDILYAIDDQVCSPETYEVPFRTISFQENNLSCRLNKVWVSVPILMEISKQLKLTVVVSQLEFQLFREVFSIAPFTQGHVATQSRPLYNGYGVFVSGIVPHRCTSCPGTRRPRDLTALSVTNFICTVRGMDTPFLPFNQFPSFLVQFTKYTGSS